jgi:SCP-2 sterol transfer family protein
MFLRTRRTFLLIVCMSGCRVQPTDSAPRTVAEVPTGRPRATASPQPAASVVAEVPTSTACEAMLTPEPAPRTWVKTCDADGRRLVTCWAGHRAVVSTCSRCILDGRLPRCEAPEVDLPALLERELPAGLARCAGRLPYRVRLRLEGERKSWLIDTVKDPPTVTAEPAGSDAKVDSTLVISRAHLLDLITDSEWDGMRMFFAGRMRIEGDQMAGMDASAWLSLPRSAERCAPTAE